MLPKKLQNLARDVAVLNGRAYLVGGSVRDKLMKKVPKDFDVEVYGVEPDVLRKVLHRFAASHGLKVSEVGASFSVFKVGQDLDVSIPRREKKVGAGHKGFEVTGDPSMTTFDAARRRDFTINAMLLDILTGEVIDHFDGRADLRDRVLRHIDDAAFAEDSLRVLRAAQFAARFGFSVGSSTVELCRRIDLSDLPAERLWGEMEKLLFSRQPSVGLFWLGALGVTAKLFPELHALVGVEQDVEWHPEGNVDTHTALVVDRAREFVDDLPYEKAVTVMLAALCHDLGKAVTTKFEAGRLRAHGHASAGVPLTEAFLDRLKVHTINGYNVREQVLKLVEYHLSPGELFRTRARTNVPGAIRRLARKLELDLLYRVSKADSLGRNYQGIKKPFDAAASEWFIEEARNLKVEERPEEPILKGRHLMDLGYRPAKWFGKALEDAYQAQLDGQFSTLEDAYNFFGRNLEKYGVTDEAKSASA